MKILFVGDKPSRLNTDPNTAFIGSRCYPRLLRWIEHLGVTDYELVNSHTPELMKKIKDHTWLRVTLGAKASQRLSKAGISHMRLPHPSGLNRQINDKELIHKVLESTRKRIRRYETIFALGLKHLLASSATINSVNVDASDRPTGNLG